MTPRVSVIVPVHNRAELIGETLESVREQTFGDFECIVVDDGSTDGTPEVVEAAIAGDERFGLVRQENTGVSGARNRGIELARGRYLAFLDSDDLFAPDRLEWQHAELERDAGVVLVYGETFHFRGQRDRGAIYMADVPDKPAGWAFERLLTCSAIYAPLVRADAARAIGGFDTSLPSGEDWDMWLRLSRLGRFAFQPRIHLYYRVHGGEKLSEPLGSYRCARRVAARHIAWAPPSRRRYLRRRVRAYFARVYPPRLVSAACQLAAQGDIHGARRAWLAAVSLRPALLRRPRLAARVLAGAPSAAPRREAGAAAPEHHRGPRHGPGEGRSPVPEPVALDACAPPRRQAGTAPGQREKLQEPMTEAPG